MTQTLIVRNDLQFHQVRYDNLDGTIFRMDFKWSARDQIWYFDLLTDENEPIRSGIRVVEGMPFLRTVAAIVRPRGELLAIDTIGEDRDPDLETFGNDVAFIYEQNPA